MATDAPQLLHQMCSDLRLLWTQAGGPPLRILSARVGLGKSQVGNILNGRIRQPPDWQVVNDLIASFVSYARDNGRTARISLSTGVEEFWKPRYAVVEHAFEQDLRAEPRTTVPRELPADVYGFTGRDSALAELDKLVGDAERGSAVVITAVSGTAGVGKTALAVHWAHRVADRFTDGQLYVDLRGYHPGQPMTPEDALATLLGSLGVSGADLPLDVAGRAARYRTVLAGRRMLVLLDNAHTADQVRPLLPGTASCLVVVTSRSDLAGLVARDGARRVDLDVLSRGEAVALLRTLVGRRVDAEPAGAASLADRCARLPLALRVAAEMAVARPATALGDLADDLRDQRRRLDLLDTGGDPHTAIRAVLSWSCRHLPPPVAGAFSLLGLHPGHDIDPYAVAALVGVDLDRSRRIIDELARAHLVEPHGLDRYGMHDLLRAYAAERAHADLATDAAHVALTRLMDHYLHAAAVAMDTAFPDERDIRPRIPAPASPAPPLGAPETARAWLDRERANLIAVATNAAGHGFPDHSLGLSQTLFRYLDGYPAAALAVHASAVRATFDGHPGRASAQTNLGLTHWRLGRPHDAIEHLQQAAAGHRAGGDRVGEMRAVGNLGLVYESLGRFTDALDRYQRVQVICRQTGPRHAEIRLLINLGSLHGRLGRHSESADHWQEAVAAARELGDRRLEGHALVGLGEAYQVLGRYREALDHLDRGLTIGREVQDRCNEGVALRGLGLAHAGLGDFPAATRHLDQSLTVLRDIGDRLMETESLNALGETLRAADQPQAAIDRHRTALDLARQNGDRPEQARALEGIAHALADTDDIDRAGQHWQQALAIYVDLDLPDADRLRQRLGS
jgi:tetratricopeptide (TPR) repeat protein